MKKILNQSFYQLLIVYTILIFLITLSLIYKYTIHIEIFALILAILSFFIVKKEQTKINRIILFLPLLLIFITRLIPYLNNSIPLGYDPGIYKHAIEGNNDLWITSAFEPLFLTFTSFLKTILTIDQILIPMLIFLSTILGLILYITTKKFFNEDMAILSIVLYSISIIQFKLFSYFYYKNTIALILLLLTFYLIKSNKLVFILTASSLAGIHKPTFLIFALTFIIYTLINKKKLKNILYGISIILLSIPFYISNFKELILESIPLVTANIGAGTFINFFQYQFLTLIYLPFGLIGLIYLIKQKQFNLITISFIILAIITYFKLFFFNRFLIHLDLFLIILAGIGIYLILDKKIGKIITLILIISGIFLIIQESINTKPLIDQEELQIIRSLSQTEINSYILVTDSYYSPWVLGYSGRKTIAPGLFDYNKWNQNQWFEFLNNQNKTVEMLQDYPKPLYIFIGKNQRDYSKNFNNPCFEQIVNKNNTKIYKLKCQDSQESAS